MSIAQRQSAEFVPAPLRVVPPSAAPAGTPRRSGRRMWYYGFGGFLALTVVGASAPQAAPPPPAAELLALAAPQQVPAQAPAANAAPAQGMDDALRLIAAARESYKGVRDYTCVLVKRERMGAALPPDSVIQMAVRTEPFSVYLRWQGPRELAGQEACYVTGRNGGKMRAHPVGALGVFGFISLDPDDPRAKQTSRHSITEAGIGNLIERFAKRWEGERDPALTQVRIADYEYNKRPCTRVETVHPTNPGGRFAYARSVVYFDKETRLPVRVETYDYPRTAGDPGQPQEVASYVNVRLNVGVGDAVFNH